MKKEALIKSYPNWNYFLKIRLNHYNTANAASNLELKMIMDQLIPIDGFKLEDLAKGYQLTKKNMPKMLIGTD